MKKQTTNAASSPNFEIIFFELSDTDCPVQEFLDSLDDKMAAGGTIMKTFRDSLNERLQDKNFRREYEDIQPEMEIIKALVDARIEQNLTQTELAEITGINQADISKLERGNRNPTLNMLKKLANGLGYTLKIEFVPKQKTI